MRVYRTVKTVKNGKTTLIVPKEFGDEIEIIMFPIKKKSPPKRKKLLEFIGKTKISDGVFKELENGRKENRF